MVVYAVAEEHSLGVYREVLEILAFPVAVIVLEYVLEGVAYGEVRLAVLVPEDVTPVFRRLAEMVDVFLLLKGQAVPVGNPVAHYLEIGEFVDQVLEVPVSAGAVPAGNRSGGESRDSSHLYESVHG